MSANLLIPVPQDVPRSKATVWTLGPIQKIRRMLNTLVALSADLTLTLQQKEQQRALLEGRCAPLSVDEALVCLRALATTDVSYGISRHFSFSFCPATPDDKDHKALEYSLGIAWPDKESKNPEAGIAANFLTSLRIPVLPCPFPNQTDLMLCGRHIA